jgi:hypothetical protein
MMKQTAGLELAAVTILCRATFFVFSMFIAPVKSPVRYQDILPNIFVSPSARMILCVTYALNCMVKNLVKPCINQGIKNCK